MALIDTDVRRTFATGIAGFSHVVDSLCAIKYAKVKTIRNEQGRGGRLRGRGRLPASTATTTSAPTTFAVWLLKTFMKKIRQATTPTVNSEPTTSILTITSNVVYGKATGGHFPDGRKAFAPFAPGR